jgi:hypothetical protein
LPARVGMYIYIYIERERGESWAKALCIARIDSVLWTASSFSKSKWSI